MTQRRTGRSLTALAALTTLALAAHATSPDLEFLQADVDEDGDVDIYDFGVINGHYADTEEDEFCTNGSHLSALDGDFDQDGIVSALDMGVYYAEFGDEMGVDVPNIPTITGVDIDTTFANTDGDAQLELVVVDEDPSPDVVLINNTGIPNIWKQQNATTDIEPDISVDAFDDGFDLTLVYDNSAGSSAATYGQVWLPGLMLDDTISVRHFGGGTAEEVTMSDTEVASPGAWGSHYAPGPRYAPLMTARSDGEDHLIGVALHYPVIEYRHGVEMYIHPYEVDDEFHSWRIRFALNADHNGNSFPEGNIPAGEIRTYTIVVRVMNLDDWTHDNDFLRLFRPYRRYFKKLYGDVKYTKDPRPVRTVAVAGSGNCTTQHDPDYGFIQAPGTSRRLNTPYDDPPSGDYGWNAWITGALEPNEDIGFPRQMIWSPAGFACDALAYTFNFQMTSMWDCVAQGDAGHPILDTLEDLDDWINDPYENRAVGFWWGRAVTPRYGWETLSHDRLDQCDNDAATLAELSTWDDTEEECRDPDPMDVSHVALAFHELDGAIAAGVQEIGLDDSRQILSADLYTWIRTMKDNYPQLRFITEPAAPDFVHTIAPNFYSVVKDGEVIYRSELLLADFLNEGHETWGYFKGEETYDELWDTPALLQDAIAEYAGYGYCCVISRNTDPGDLTDPENVSRTITDFNAADNYSTLIPSDLQ